jgi:hypothetical protein
VTVKIAQIVSEIASASDSLGKTEMKKVLTFTKKKKNLQGDQIGRNRPTDECLLWAVF